MSGASTFGLSVVVPTFNRRAQLHQVLCALAAQTTDQAFEVVVVSDGSTDGTDEYLESCETPCAVVALRQANAGPATARNRGVQAARGALILFVDDDVVPAPDLVERHLAAHRAAGDDAVVIGPMLNPEDFTMSPWVAWEQHQLYKQYEAMRRGDYPPTFRQFYTGNASLSRQRILDAGMFDVSLLRAEDVELAYRLHQVGMTFVFDPTAKAYHHADRSFTSWLRTPHAYGQNDVEFMRNGQQWLRAAMANEFQQRNAAVRFLARHASTRPRRAKLVTATLAPIARSTRAGRLQRPLLSALFGLAYYRGVAEAVGSAGAFTRLLDGRRGGPPTIAFVLEQTLGHITHSDNLQLLLSDCPALRATFLPIAFDIDGPSARLPGWSNWTIRAGVRARRSIRLAWRERRIDAMFIHTQVPAILTGRWMRRIPTVVSLDATPIQYDELGSHYAHARSSERVERWKRLANQRCFQRAVHLVAWAEWTRDSLVTDYGVDPAKISVIAPGVHVDRWQRKVAPPITPVRVLFVGGDLDRKGGRLLLEAARVIRSDPSAADFELHLVTRSPVEPEVGIFVHATMTPNSDELISLYHSAHIFCLPTLGDCLPMVLSEAGVAGLALISTDVGAISEIVRDDDTGLLIPPDDLDALVAALRRLLADPGLRAQLGENASALVRTAFDARINAGRLVDLLVPIAEHRVMGSH